MGFVSRAQLTSRSVLRIDLSHSIHDARIHENNPFISVSVANVLVSHIRHTNGDGPVGVCAAHAQVTLGRVLKQVL